MDGVLPRENVEKMDVKDLQTLYQHVAAIWPDGLKPYHWNTGSHSD